MAHRGDWVVTGVAVKPYWRQTGMRDGVETCLRHEERCFHYGFMVLLSHCKATGSQTRWRLGNSLETALTNSSISLKNVILCHSVSD